ncbi:TetR/AcrR family transcriptional regulator [Actinokineospora iranica]|uniref:DNA-binding transcriptional regulator, AcrR family n=1 Tax=Actinokineospora iranica TaxID=1271860 RepID=A0A1G6W7T2_9PSEU|nr:TetR/AcrR family transcriptional regulator [Actinokineospora iranica]SDD61116.1 DNA-binding transcriptional regulator, AcrR family [Actinokineospora iranica]
MTSDTRPLRADAERNRVRIVVAAREVFAAHGLSVTLDDVARSAGVGVGTVYRRFPNKEALVIAVFDHVLDEITTLLDKTAADEDAWRGLTGLITAIAERQAADRGLFDLCTNADFGQADRIAEHFIPAADSLVARAKAQGALRDDFAAPDIGPLLMMVAATAEMTRTLDPDLWRRYLALLLDGIRAGATTPLPGPTPTHAEMQTVMHCSSSRQP